MEEVKKKLLLSLMFCLLFPLVVFALSKSVIAEVSGTATTNLSGTWNCTENYTCCGDYPSQWTFTFLTTIVKNSLSINIYKMNAKRTSSGSVKQGIAFEVPSKHFFIAAHPCYGDGCVDCNYVFVGIHMQSSDSLRGKNTYKCEDGYVADGKFTATKISGSITEGEANEQSGAPDPDPR